MLLFSHYVAEIEDKRFYDYSPEFIADQKSEDYRIIYGLAEYNFWSDDKQSDGFIRRDAAKKIGLKSVIGIPLIYNDEAIGVLKIGTKKSANYLNNYIRIFQRLEVFIGSELNRKNSKMILVIYLMQFRYHLRFRFSREVSQNK
jgi:hypothetical protein